MQHVLRISGAAGNAMGSAKDAIVMCSEEDFQLSRRVWNWFQGSNSCLHDALLKFFPLNKRATGGIINNVVRIFWGLEKGKAIFHLSFS